MGSVCALSRLSRLGPPTNRILHTIAAMPPKPAGELTADEIRLLGVAAKLFAAARQRAGRPPPESEAHYWANKVEEDLVSLGHCTNNAS